MGREGTVAVQGRGFLAPGFSRGTYRFARVIGRTYMRLLLGVRKTEITGMEHVHAAMLRFQKGETRLMVLFRHVGVADGPLVIKMLSQDLERWSRAQRKPLLRPPHAHFLYGKDALNWAGAMARWSFPRMGGIPVVNGRIDRQSQTTLRRTLTTGEFPLAFAPEGQVTYHQFRTFEMTAGAGTLAHWTYRDLRAAEDLTTRVEILPVAIGYSSRERDASVLREIVRRIEIAVGREATRGAAPKSGEADIPDTAKLLELTRAVVSQIEREFPFARQTGAGKDDEPLQNRIDGLCDAALRCGERAVGLSGEGSTLERVFRLRNWITGSRYRDDVMLEDLPAITRIVANKRAALASSLVPYEGLADILEYLKIDYLEEDGPPSLHRRIEYGMNLLDVINRANGGDIDDRYVPANRTASIIVGEAMDASAVFEHSDRARGAIDVISSQVKSRLESLTRSLERQLQTTQDQGDA